MKTRFCVIIVDSASQAILERVVFDSKEEADAFAAQRKSDSCKPVVFPLDEKPIV